MSEPTPGAERKPRFSFRRKPEESRGAPAPEPAAEAPATIPEGLTRPPTATPEPEEPRGPGILDSVSASVRAPLDRFAAGHAARRAEHDARGRQAATTAAQADVQTARAREEETYVRARAEDALRDLAERQAQTSDVVNEHHDDVMTATAHIREQDEARIGGEQHRQALMDQSAASARLGQPSWRRPLTREGRQVAQIQRETGAAQLAAEGATAQTIARQDEIRQLDALRRAEQWPNLTPQQRIGRLLDGITAPDVRGPVRDNVMRVLFDEPGADASWDSLLNSQGNPTVQQLVHELQEIRDQNEARRGPQAAPERRTPTVADDIAALRIEIADPELLRGFDLAITGAHPNFDFLPPAFRGRALALRDRVYADPTLFAGLASRLTDRDQQTAANSRADALRTQAQNTYGHTPYTPRTTL